jgi:adenosine kinase
MSFPGHFREHILPDHLDSISLSFLVDEMVRQPGGTATNIAYNLALLGERPRLMATAGVDFEEYRRWLESKNVDTALVKIIPGKYTASFFVNTDLDNNQIATFYAGAMAHACELSLRDLKPNLPELMVISANDPGAMRCYSRECVELGVPYLYDPSQQIVRISADDLREGVEGAQSLFVNEYEFELLQKHTGLTPNEISNKVEFMVITLGEDGSDIYADGKKVHVPVVPPIHIAEPTGVGDAFRGGFVRGMQLGLTWETCGKMGALSATYCLEQKGTQNHSYTIEEYIARFRQHFDDEGALDVLLKNA